MFLILIYFRVVVVFFLYPSRSFPQILTHSHIRVQQPSTVHFKVNLDQINTTFDRYYTTFPQCRSCCDLFEL